MFLRGQNLLIDQENIDNKIANQADKRLYLCRKGGLIAASEERQNQTFGTPIP